MQVNTFTYADAIDHARDYCGAALDPQTDRFCRKAVQSAIQAAQGIRNWTFYYQRGRILTSASYSTGTVAFDYTGGAVERQLTLTSGTWPTWAADGVVWISNVPYTVSSRISSTVLQLTHSGNPGEDVASTEYSISRESYTLPVDFGAMGEIAVMGQNTGIYYVKPDEFITIQSNDNSTGLPCRYTLTGDPRRLGAMVIRFQPMPNAVYAVDFSYRRQARRLGIDLYSTGTVSTTSGLTTLSGTGTSWNSHMVGSVIRFAQDASGDVPTGLSGASPFYLERTIASFTNSLTMALDADPQLTLSGVKYAISDPVDIEPGAMLTYFLREVERQIRITRRIKAMEIEELQHRDALMAACEMDSRHHEMRNLYGTGPYPLINWYAPIGAEVGG